jgi:epoxyqueuosine reductase
MMPPNSHDTIETALSLGFSSVALLPVDVIRDHARRYSVCGYANDPRELMPTAKSVLVLATAFPGFWTWPEGCGEVSAFYFASQKAYVALCVLQRLLSERGIQADRRQLLPSKRMGMLSGFGLIGKNTLLQNEQWGSRFVLHTLVTDIEAPPSGVGMNARPCEDCGRCVEACPTRALSADEGMRMERCLRFHMMNGRIPEPYRRIMYSRLLGCEICQRVCPRQPAQALSPAARPEDFAIERLLLCEPDYLRAIGERIGTNAARPLKIQAQAAIVAGNSGDAKYLPILQKLTLSTNETVAEHAEWAIQNIQISK